MCIACELGFLIAMDELPDAPPAGFPAPAAGEATRFVCDAPAEEPPAAAAPAGEDEREP